MNTIIYYLYRDADNYKKSNAVIVSGTFTKEQIKDIVATLKSGRFIPSQVGLPETRFGAWTDADHAWFELEEYNFRETQYLPTVPMSAEELYQKFMAVEKWDDVAYAKAHMDDIPIAVFKEYIPNSDEFELDDCRFEEE